MDDVIVFDNFLQRLGLNLNRQRNAITDSFGDTFEQFSSSSDDDIDEFVKQNNDANRSRAAAARVVISTRVINDLKATLFDLRDRAKCVATLNAAQLNALDHATLGILRTLRSNAVRENAQRQKKTLLPMEVPKLTRNNWSDFKLAVSESLRRIFGVN